MSMHLASHAYTTNNTKKRKEKKPTKAMMAQWEADYASRKREWKRNGEPIISFETWLNERRGIVAPAKTVSKTAKNLPTLAIPEGRGTRHIPSLMNNAAGVATKKDSPVYTGTNMIGIGQLHKSNAVPVFKQEDAEDIAKMRR